MPSTYSKFLSVITRFFVGLIILSGAIGIFLFLVTTKQQPIQTPHQKNLPHVRVISALQVNVKRQWRGFGSVTAMDTTDVPTRVTSTVIAIADALEAGSLVRKGQLLVQLDDSDFLRQEEIAHQNLTGIDEERKNLAVQETYLKKRLILQLEQQELAVSQHKRTTDLIARGAGTQQDVDRAREAVLSKEQSVLQTREKIQLLTHQRGQLNAQHQAQASALRRAGEDVSRCQIISLIDGILESLDVEVGEHVTSGRRIGRVVNPTQMEVQLKLPASARASVQVGDEVVLSAVGEEDHLTHTTISRISPVDDPDMRTFNVYVELRSNGKRWVPGRFAQGVVKAAEPTAHWLVPGRSIAADRLTLVRQGVIVTLGAKSDFLVRQAYPQTGLSDTNWTALKIALLPEDLVVITPSRTLTDGKKVRPMLVGENLP